MIRRNITRPLLEALADRPVVLVNGARQTGKSTLVQWLARDLHPARYVTLDDATVLAAAREDPPGFLQGFEGPVILDEVQRVPELFLAIKTEVDRDRSPGRFLLTGSADVLLLPRLSESLAGRMEIHTLWPLSQGEIESVQEEFVDAVFARSAKLVPGPRLDRADLLDRILAGGYPDVISRRSPSRRAAWFGSYVTTILQRDVRDLANIEHLTTMPRLLALLAARVGSLLNFSEISRSLGLPQSTLKRYVALFETAFLFQPLPAWSGNLGMRLIKSPKVMLNDSALAAHLMGLDRRRLRKQPSLAGPLLEGFVVTELRKQVGWSRTQPRLFHFRTPAGQEVDIVLEDAAGSVVGIEVKASASVRADDFKGLRALRDALGSRFVRGIVLYTGFESVAFGPKLSAQPITVLWRTSSS
ncbi:MAG: ATP-binding protein [Candidatus Eisenbacteria sp.]|nr:ATP-binding protein [Candidatus Eisenbacteria bacterium]